MNTAGNMTAVGIVSAIAYYAAEFIVGTTTFVQIDPGGHLMPLVVAIITSLIVPIYKAVDTQLEKRNLDLLPDYGSETTPYDTYGTYEGPHDPSLEYPTEGL